MSLDRAFQKLLNACFSFKSDTRYGLSKLAVKMAHFVKFVQFLLVSDTAIW